ncbi:MAG: Bifunctional homocysteine S-methyltransferase/5,10-methylenetetrahydrofolate reductase [candidate division BRC1 bacterium ADurb.BinA292]|nr:MAG: Bifunctional homocysteine S-methyltransferase/5,10-methylenetetrahydrofolate reductase [candidate division BRC1 bacterium ADurb.BinA292]
MSVTPPPPSLRNHPFMRALAERAVLFDGGMGTMLYQRGVFITQCFEQQNLLKPDLVRELHAAYVRSGAEVLETNTFGANRIKLARHGIEPDEMRAIIQAGVRLARDAGGQKIWVAGSVGPSGRRFGAPGDDGIDPARAHDLFLEHAGLLAEAGVDLLVLETFREMRELEAAVAAAREAAPHLPIVALLTPDAEGNTADGLDLEQVARRLEALAPAAGGFNDGAGPDGMFHLMRRMAKAAPGLTLAAQPFIGGVETIEDRTIHLATTEFTGVYARRMFREGVRVLGLCCGATPAHIKAMRNALSALQPGAQKSAGIQVVGPSEAEPVEQANRPVATRFARKVAAGEFVVSVEIDPPQGTDISKALESARKLRDSGRVDVINIADGPRALARINPSSMALILKRDFDMEAIIHYCCRDRNLLAMQADLLAANALGLHNILLITGDPPKMGDYPDATAVFDVDAIGLTRIVTRLNQGRDLAGNSIGEPTRFFQGVGANPGAQDINIEIERLQRKRDAGARYVMTQPVYNAEVFERFIERAAPLGLPILIGILPLRSLRNALFLHNNVPGMAIPAEVLARMEAAPEGADQRRAGWEIAREALRRALPYVQGTYIMPPFGSAEDALAVLEALD